MNKRIKAGWILGIVAGIIVFAGIKHAAMAYEDFAEDNIVWGD